MMGDQEQPHARVAFEEIDDSARGIEPAGEQ
jgi:hypothetical protein